MRRRQKGHPFWKAPAKHMSIWPPAVSARPSYRSTRTSGSSPQISRFRQFIKADKVFGTHSEVGLCHAIEANMASALCWTGIHPVRPKAELNDSHQACVYTRETVGRSDDVDVKKSESKSLNHQLVRPNGVICPPPDIGPDMRGRAAPTSAVPVIPPTGSPGGNPHVRPK
jgi:hypothetical protein